MSLVWQYYWPVLLAAAIVGILAGRGAFRQPKLPDDLPREATDAAELQYQRRKNKFMALGAAAVLLLAAVWHWPLGGARRLAAAVQTEITSELRRVDTPEFSARLARMPLSRTLIVTGSANPFQRDGFVRLFREVPGVSSVRWSDEPRGIGLPLFVEALLLCLLGYAAGLFFSWIVEIRRRVNSYWNW